MRGLFIGSVWPASHRVEARFQSAPQGNAQIADEQVQPERVPEEPDGAPGGRRGRQGAKAHPQV